MGAKKHHFLHAKVVFMGLALMIGGKNAYAAIDHFSFCTNSCKPNLCSTESKVKSQCESMCNKPEMLNQVADLQASKLMSLEEREGLSKATKGIKDFDKRKKTSYEIKKHKYPETDIYKCLGLKEPKEPLDSEATIAPQQAMTKDDMCKAAIRAEMSALQNQSKTLEEVLRSLQN